MAAVILPKKHGILGLDDSKKLSHSKRERIFEEIKSVSISYAIGIVGPEEIDRINILQAALLAMEISVKKLTTKPDYLLIDGNQKTSLLLMQETIVKGDSKSCSIAAASIIAKVARDSIMKEYDLKYPEYNFKGHKGYPTKEHYDAFLQGEKALEQLKVDSGSQELEQRDWRVTNAIRLKADLGEIRSTIKRALKKEVKH